MRELTVSASGLATVQVVGYYQTLHDYLPVICVVLSPLSSADFLVLGIAYTSWVPHGSGLDLFGTCRPELVWSADRHPSPSTTTTLNTGPSYLPFEQEISHDILQFWQPPGLHPSGYEEEILMGTLLPRSVHAVSYNTTYI